MNASSLGFPIRVAQRLWRELAASSLLDFRPRRENAIREKKWKGKLENTVHSILVVQLADIGDLVLTSVFLRHLRGHFPRARIVLLVAPFIATYADLCPHIDEVITLDYPLLGGADWKLLLCGSPAWWYAASEIRERYFLKNPPDLAISVRTHRDAVQVVSQIVLATSHARRRVGYPLKPLLGYLRSRHLLDTAVPLPTRGHEIERQLRLLEGLGVHSAEPGPIELWSSTETEEKAEQVWREIRMKGGRRFIGLGIGAGRPEKCWPLQRFATLAQQLESEQGVVPVLIGGNADRKDAEQIVSLGQLTQTINLCGQMQLEVTAAFIKGLDVFVGNDSGPMHLAAAAGVPVVGIFGPEDAERWGPWTDLKEVVTLRLPCSPCSSACRFEINHCLQDLGIDPVMAAIHKLSAKKP